MSLALANFSNINITETKDHFKPQKLNCSLGNECCLILFFTANSRLSQDINILFSQNWKQSKWSKFQESNSDIGQCRNVAYKLVVGKIDSWAHLEHISPTPHQISLDSTPTEDLVRVQRRPLCASTLTKGQALTKTSYQNALVHPCSNNRFVILPQSASDVF